MSQYNAIVVGAGHNGLVCAAYLAQSGRRVLVLESSDAVGGLAACHEFHPGFHVSAAHTVRHFSQKVAADLGLVNSGLDAVSGAPSTIALARDAGHITIEADTVRGVGDDDTAAYREYSRLLGRFADVLAPFWQETMPRIGAAGLAGAMTFGRIGLRLRRLGKKDMREFLRIVSLPARDLMDEFFSDERLKAALCWDGLLGSRLAPRSPNSAVLMMLYRMAGHTSGHHVVAAHGVQGLIDSLRQAAENAGAEIRCGTRVDSIRVDSDRSGLSIAGVHLADGQSVDADIVISSADPKRTFIDLVGVKYLDIGFVNRIRRLRCNGYVGKLHLALDGLPEVTGLDAAHGRLIIAPSMDAMESAFDAAKYGDCSPDPVIEIVVPTLHDPSLAPAGKHVLSAHVMYVPYQLKSGWTDAARDRICARSIDAIERYVPHIREKILHAEFLTPSDLEQRFNVTGGHWHHAEFAMDQMLMMRPTYDAAQYRTPLPGLYLCGAGSHPGGDLTGMAGRNAAREILK